jgi:pyruvate-formate lyase-activating enzyme
MTSNRAPSDDVDHLVAAHGVRAAAEQRRVAALIFTYRCTIACRHCGFGCAADRPEVRMTPDQAVRHLHALRELGRVVHIAGGECMMYWPELHQTLLTAQREGVSPHFLETNCSWAHSDDVVRQRLQTLAERGVRGLLASADTFHQAFVEPDNYLRVRRLAREIFGAANFWGPDAEDDTIRRYAEIARDEQQLAARVRRHPPVLVGSAYVELRHHFPEHPLDDLPLETGWGNRYATRDCMGDWAAAKMWEIHIDPYDNIMSNCGVILGNANDVRIADVMARGPHEANWIARLLATEGPWALAHYAAEHHGYALPSRERTKCSLCYAVRKFLRPHYPDLLGPAEIYA